jgi:RHS repeat-associated protein
VGNRTSKTDMDGKVEAYAYDNTYRLTEARYGDGSREAFTYDPVGNRMTRTDESGTQTVYSYDIANQLLRAGNDTFIYDANGSVTSKTTLRGTTTLVYDGQNRVTSIAGPDGNETSVWGADGTRVRMNNATQSYGDSKIIYDLRGNAVFETGFGVYRVFGPGVDEVLGENKANGTIRFIHHDALGSVTAATDLNGVLKYRRTYRAFGQIATATATDDADQVSRYAFTGRELSVGTMMQYRSRFYDITQGRFLQRDSYRGHDITPPSLQRFTYVHNNPVRYVDPSGHAIAVFKNLADLGNALTLPKPIVETIYWAALDFLAFFAALMAAGPAGSAAWVALLGYFVLGIGIGIGVLEVYLNSRISLGEKVFLLGLWIAISLTMYFLGGGIFAMLVTSGGALGLAGAPSSAILAGAAIVSLTSYLLWLIDQSFTTGLEAGP